MQSLFYEEYFLPLNVLSTDNLFPLRNDGTPNFNSVEVIHLLIQFGVLIRLGPSEQELTLHRLIADSCKVITQFPIALLNLDLDRHVVDHV